MRHRIAGKRLGRTSSHRKALRRNMAASLIQHGAIRTTEQKAKELRRFVERIITVAKEGTLHARRRVMAVLGDRAMTDDQGEFLDDTVVQKLFKEVAPRFANREGGYTRIIRLEEYRIGDAGTQVVIQLVEEGTAGKGRGKAGSSRRKARAEKCYKAAAAVKVAASAKKVPAEEADASEDASKE